MDTLNLLIRLSFNSEIHYLSNHKRILVIINVLTFGYLQFSMNIFLRTLAALLFWIIPDLFFSSKFRTKIRSHNYAFPFFKRNAFGQVFSYLN